MTKTHVSVTLAVGVGLGRLDERGVLRGGCLDLRGLYRDSHRPVPTAAETSASCGHKRLWQCQLTPGSRRPSPVWSAVAWARDCPSSVAFPVRATSPVLRVSEGSPGGLRPEPGSLCRPVNQSLWGGAWHLFFLSSPGDSHVGQGEDCCLEESSGDLSGLEGSSLMGVIKSSPREIR